MPEALICGAGKIGRGFLGQLLHRSGYGLRFIDGADVVVNALNREKRYRIDIAGRSGSTEYIPVLSAHLMSDTATASDAVRRADLIVCAVGAPNLVPLARAMAGMFAARDLSQPLDWLICENADQPAQKIRATLLEHAQPPIAEFVKTKLGLVETQVLRTGMLPDAEIQKAEPLALKMHDWWTLPCDADAFRGPIPRIEGLQPRQNFGNELTRKIYTFNGLNGPISYLGYANGYRILHEAALAPELQPLLEGVKQESAHGLIHEFQFDPREQQQFQHLAWSKYRDPALADPIERNARDSARKLGPRERLLGPALLCLKHGRPPLAYASAAAAAIAYTGSTDAGTVEVQKVLAERGVEAVLKQFCGLDESSELFGLIASAFQSRSFLTGVRK